jgi:hypothetical protein
MHAYYVFIGDPVQDEYVANNVYTVPVRVLQQVLWTILNRTIGLEIIEWIIHVHTLWIFHGYGYPLGKLTNA